MNYIIKLLLGALVELAVKYAEKKYNEAKMGDEKRAYVLNKVDALFDDEQAAEFKSEALAYTDKKIDKTVDKLFNAKK